MKIEWVSSVIYLVLWCAAFKNILELRHLDDLAVYCLFAFSLSTLMIIYISNRLTFYNYRLNNIVRSVRNKRALSKPIKDKFKVKHVLPVVMVNAVLFFFSSFQVHTINMSTVIPDLTGLGGLYIVSFIAMLNVVFEVQTSHSLKKSLSVMLRTAG
jgi:hypothetical protein